MPDSYGTVAVGVFVPLLARRPSRRVAKHVGFLGRGVVGLDSRWLNALILLYGVHIGGFESRRGLSTIRTSGKIKYPFFAKPTFSSTQMLKLFDLSLKSM